MIDFLQGGTFCIRSVLQHVELWMELELMIARSKSMAPQEHSNLARYHSPRQGDGAVGLLFDDIVCRFTCYVPILLYGV